MKLKSDQVSTPMARFRLLAKAQKALEKMAGMFHLEGLAELETSARGLRWKIGRHVAEAAEGVARLKSERHKAKIDRAIKRQRKQAVAEIRDARHRGEEAEDAS
ncbi:MAG: hypothetical protein V2A71_10485 [Candidatus Eisenbacteria bacterium]